MAAASLSRSWCLADCAGSAILATGEPFLMMQAVVLVKQLLFEGRFELTCGYTAKAFCNVDTKVSVCVYWRRNTFQLHMCADVSYCIHVTYLLVYVCVQTD